MARKRRSPITAKQKKLIQGIKKGLSITEAGRRAGYAHPNVSAYNAYKKLKLRFHPALEAAGYQVSKELVSIYGKMAALREAKVVNRITHQGVTLETHHDADNDVQLRASVESARFLGVIGNGHGDDEDKNTSRVVAGGVTVNLGFLGQDAEARILNAIRELHSRSNSGQPVLDVERHEDQGRSRLVPSL